MKKFFKRYIYPVIKFFWKICFFIFDYFVFWLTRFCAFIFFDIINLYRYFKVGGKFFTDLFLGIDFFMHFILRRFLKDEKFFFKVEVKTISFILTLAFWFNLLLCVFSLCYCCWCTVEPYLIYFFENYPFLGNEFSEQPEYVMLDPLRVYFIFWNNIFALIHHGLVLIYERLFYIYFYNRWFLYFFLCHYPSQFDFV